MSINGYVQTIRQRPRSQSNNQIQKNLTHLTLKQWAAVEAAFVKGTCGVPELARNFKVSATTIYRHARREDWNSKREADLHPVPESKTESFGISGVFDGETGMQVRLLALLDQTLCEIEVAFRIGEPRTAADRERDARTLGAIMRILEKLNDQKKPGEDTMQARWLTRDDDTICRELAKEIESFERQRKADAR